MKSSHRAIKNDIRRLVLTVVIRLYKHVDSQQATREMRTLGLTRPENRDRKHLFKPTSLLLLHKVHTWFPTARNNSPWRRSDLHSANFEPAQARWRSHDGDDWILQRETRPFSLRPRLRSVSEWALYARYTGAFSTTWVHSVLESSRSLEASAKMREGWLVAVLEWLC